MLRLRKGKKELARFKSLYEFADMESLISEIYGPHNLQAVQSQIRKCAFGMAISGAKVRLGRGYIIEQC